MFGKHSQLRERSSAVYTEAQMRPPGVSWAWPKPGTRPVLGKVSDAFPAGDWWLEDLMYHRAAGTVNKNHHRFFRDEAQGRPLIADVIHNGQGHTAWSVGSRLFVEPCGLGRSHRWTRPSYLIVAWGPRWPQMAPDGPQMAPGLAAVLKFHICRWHFF